MNKVLLFLILPIIVLGQIPRTSGYVDAYSRAKTRAVISDSIGAERTARNTAINDSNFARVGSRVDADFRFVDQVSIPQMYATDTDTVGDGTHDDTAEIQSALDNAGYVFLAKPASKYVISSHLKIKSDTYLHIEPGTEIYLADASSDYMITNWNWQNDSGVFDTNIVIQGGIWNGNGTNQTGSTWPNYMGNILVMDSVKSVVLRDCFFKHAENFCGAFYNSERIRLYNTGFDNEKDGIDFVGKTKDVFIDGSYGHTDDDMHAFSIGGYSSQYNPSNGDIENVTVQNIQCYDIDTTDAETYGAKSVVYCGGGANSTNTRYKFKNFTISNITGNVSTYPVRIITGSVAAGAYTSGQQYTSCEDFTIEKINTETTAYPNVRFKASFAENILFQNISVADSNAQAHALELGDTTNAGYYRDIRIDQIHGGYNHGNLIQIEDETNFEGLTITNVTGKNSPSKYLIQTGNTVSFGNYFDVSNCNADSVGLIYIGNGTTIDGCVVNITDCNISDYSAPIYLRAAGTYNLSDINYDNVVYAYQAIGYAINIKGNGCTTTNYESYGYNSGATLSQDNPSIIIDTDGYLNNEQNGDRVYARSTSSDAPVSAVVQFNTTDNLWHLYQNKYLLYTFTGDPPSINAAAAWDTTFTISGLSTTADMIVVDAPYDLSNYFLWTARISATNTVRIKLYNTHSAAVNQAAFADTWRVMVFKRP